MDSCGVSKTVNIKTHFKVTESGHPSARMERGELESLVGVRCGENASRVPLLYSMLSAVRKKTKC